MKLPIFIEHSKVPGLISLVTPIRVWSITIPPFVFCEEKADECTVVHELIHLRQWIELGFLGFVFVYPLFWLLNLVRGMDIYAAHFHNPLELEAHSNENNHEYLVHRKKWAWINYLKRRDNG
jgi:hypothetical protein